MNVSRGSGSGEESALAGSNTIVQRRRKGTGPSQEWEFAADFLKQLLSTKSVFISSQKHLDTNFVSRFYPGYLWVCI